jgi:beta-1,2-mannobiose phosphorylase / 1,2-beta-oligomannan phosphorylase
MKGYNIKHILAVLIILLSGTILFCQPVEPMMMFGDTSRTGSPFSKDPHVISFNGRYLMYYSIPTYKDKSNPVQGWGIGIAESKDLLNWKKIGEVTPAADYENKGLCAPCARVINGIVHLFYQTYGNGRNDAICHAYSDDGIHFMRDITNPVFRPGGNWNCGRAIDAEVIKFKGKYYLYYATRDPEYKIQMQGVAVAQGNTNFKHNDWNNLSTDSPILKPDLSWEKDCIEGASVIKEKGKLYMFYAGAYNNAPQQIGVAVSEDAINWKRLSDKPFLTNGKPGEWNSSESGHPHVFKDRNGKTYLFFQGNNDNGKTWYISKVEVRWNRKGPFLKNQ